MSHQNFVGEWADAVDGRTYTRENPADARITVGRFADSTPADVELATRAATAAQPAWAALSSVARGQIVARAAELLRRRSDTIGADLSAEEGKPLAEAIGEVLRAADVLDYFAATGRMTTGQLYDSSRPGVVLLTRRHALGVVGAITPFNFPALVPCFKIGAALMAGNAVVWKPSPATPMTGLHIVKAFLDAELPTGLLCYLTGTSPELGQALVTNAAIAAVSFTGSTHVGAAVEVLAAQHGTRAQVEKGGSNPLIVLSDADLPAAVDALVDGAFFGTGQKCTATSRVFVERPIQAAMLDLITERAKALQVGPGTDPRTQVGPLVTRDARDRVVDVVQRAVAAGARVTAGGQQLDGELEHGYFYPPTVLADVDRTMAIVREEVFGPVVTITPVDDLNEAIAGANDTPYGLSAGIFTSNLAAVDRFISNVRAGVLNVNLPTTGIEPHVPFGGLKASGSGPKELGPSALDFFTQESTVAVRPGDR